MAQVRGKTINYNLSERMNAFVTLFRKDPDRIAAYVGARYVEEGHEYTDKQLYNKATAVLRGVKVKAELERRKHDTVSTHDTNEDYTIDWVRRKHVELIRLSIKKQDYSTATANVAWIGKSCGAYNEGNQITVEEVKRFAESDKIQISHIAQLLIDKQLNTDAEVIDVDFVDPEPTQKLLQAASGALDEVK